MCTSTKVPVHITLVCPGFLPKIMKDLELQGIDLNMHDMCVVHKMVKDKQMMIF